MSQQQCKAIILHIDIHKKALSFATSVLYQSEYQSSSLESKGDSSSSARKRGVRGFSTGLENDAEDSAPPPKRPGWPLEPRSPKVLHEGRPSPNAWGSGDPFRDTARSPDPHHSDYTIRPATPQGSSGRPQAFPHAWSRRDHDGQHPGYSYESHQDIGLSHGSTAPRTQGTLGHWESGSPHRRRSAEPLAPRPESYGSRMYPDGDVRDGGYRPQHLAPRDMETEPGLAYGKPILCIEETTLN